MLAYYGDRISPHMTTTPEGFLICHDVPIARTGEMDYRASELALDGGPDRLVKVYRHQEDVFDPAAQKLQNFFGVFLRFQFGVDTLALYFFPTKKLFGYYLTVYCTAPDSTVFSHSFCILAR